VTAVVPPQQLRRIQAQEVEMGDVIALLRWVHGLGVLGIHMGCGRDVVVVDRR